MAGLELNVVLLCFTMAVCTFALASKTKPDWHPAKILTNRKTYVIVAAAAFALAVFVRVWKFGAVPAGMNQDGAMAAVDALALASHGTDRFGAQLPVYFEAWGYGQMSVLLSYLMVPFIKLFGLNAVTARLPMLLASLAGLWVLFRFTQRVFGKATALLALLITAVNPWHIMQSRWALDCNLLPHFLLFSLYFLHRGLDKRGYLYLSMVFFALTMYTYGIAFVTIPLLLTALCAWLLAKRRITPVQAAFCAGIYLAIAWPVFAVVAINTFKLPTWRTGLITMQYFPHSIRTNDLIFYSKDVFKQALENIRSLSDMAILEKGDFGWNTIRQYGQLYLFSLPFVATGLWALFRRRKTDGSDAAALAEPPADGAGRYLLAAWIGIAVITGLIVNGVNTNRINVIFYPMCLLAALGIRHVLLEAIPLRRIALAVAVAYAVSFGGFTVTYFGEHAKAMERDFCAGLPEAVRYADSLDADVLYITSYSRDESAYTCSEIYTLFGASVDAAYFQGNAEAFHRVTGKKLLPYRERYRYVDFDSFTFDQPKGAVYVYNADESTLFDESEYDTAAFGGFRVAVKLRDWVEPSADEGGPADAGGDGAVEPVG